MTSLSTEASEITGTCRVERRGGSVFTVDLRAFLDWRGWLLGDGFFHGGGLFKPNSAKRILLTCTLASLTCK